jgi:hypothetical protein
VEGFVVDMDRVRMIECTDRVATFVDMNHIAMAVDMDRVAVADCTDPAAIVAAGESDNIHQNSLFCGRFDIFDRNSLLVLDAGGRNHRLA